MRALIIFSLAALGLGGLALWLFGGDAKAAGAGGTTPKKVDPSNYKEPEFASLGEEFKKALALVVYEESRGKVDAWNADDVGYGVSVGIVQFNQKVGTLPTLFSRMSNNDPDKFAEIFGQEADLFRDAKWVRSADLNARKDQVQRALREFGKEIQEQAVYDLYWTPATSYLPDGKKTFLFKALALSLWLQFRTDEAKNVIDQSQTAQDVVEKTRDVHGARERQQRILDAALKIGGAS